MIFAAPEKCPANMAAANETNANPTYAGTCKKLLEAATQRLATVATQTKTRGTSKDSLGAAKIMTGGAGKVPNMRISLTFYAKTRRGVYTRMVVRYVQANG